MKERKIAIIIPTYNEAANIVRIIDLIRKEPLPADIIVVDDNSPDGTAARVKKLQKSCIRLFLKERKAKLGLASAYLETMQDLVYLNSYYAIATMDGDLSHHPKFLTYMVDALNSHDVVVGSRYITGGGIKNWPLFRKALSFSGNLYARTILDIGVRDLTSGFMLMRIDALKKIRLPSISSAGYAFLMELKFALVLTGARITEIPIIFTNRIDGASKISTHIVREGILMPLILRRRKAVWYSNKTVPVKSS